MNLFTLSFDSSFILVHSNLLLCSNLCPAAAAAAPISDHLRGAHRSGARCGHATSRESFGAAAAAQQRTAAAAETKRDPNSFQWR